MSEEQAAANTPLESFFDLVYVLAFSQVTQFLSNHLNGLGILQGAALLAALWWAWVSYSWLTDAAPAHDMLSARVLILAAVAGMGVASLALPEAFGRSGLLFACAYLAVRLLHVGLYMLTTEETSRTRRAILRLAPGLLGAPALLVVASLVPGPVRGVLWAAALAIDFGTPLIRGVKGLQVHAEHFTDRHGLVIILALGESIAGIGSTHPQIRTGVVLAALLGIVLSAALWWAYFDYASEAAQSRLEDVEGDERARLARDAYSYVHLAMVAGIIFMALGLRKTITGVERPLETIPAIALCGGVALYLLGLNAFRLRMTGTVRVARLVAAALSCALLAVAPAVPSIVTLALSTALSVGLIGFETLFPDKLRREAKENG